MKSYNYDYDYHYNYYYCYCQILHKFVRKIKARTIFISP